jgi:L-aspartate oxidase
MGSNSLIEGLVLGETAGRLAASEGHDGTSAVVDLPFTSARSKPPTDVKLSIEDLTYSLKSLMWRQMGIVRSGAAIEDAISKLAFWTGAVERLGNSDNKSWELVNMLTLARLASESALARTESRGTHERSDHPKPDPAWRVHTLLTGVEQGGTIAALVHDREPIADSALVP